MQKKKKSRQELKYPKCTKLKVILTHLVEIIFETLEQTIINWSHFCWRMRKF